MINKRWVLALLGVLLLLLAGGCWDYREPDEVAWVMAVGLDKGRENLLRVTFQVAIPKDISGGGEEGGGGGGQGYFVTSMEAPSFLAAIEMMNAFVDRQGDLTHAQVVIFSRELAERDISRYFMSLNRFFQFRPSTRVMVCQDTAEETLRQAMPVLENSPGKYWELITAGWKYTEFIPRDGFRFIDANLRTPGAAAVVPLIGLEREKPGPPDPTFKPKGEQIAGSLARKGGVKIEFFGAALFSEGRMVGTLNGDQTGVLKFVRGTAERTIKHVLDPHEPGHLIILRVTPRGNRPHIDIDLRGDGPPRVRAVIPVEANIMSIYGRTEWDRPERIPELEKMANRALNEDALVAVQRLQEMGADGFGFGWQAKRHFLTWEDWENYRWDDKFPQADIEVVFDLQIRQAGLVHETHPLLGRR